MLSKTKLFCSKLIFNYYGISNKGLIIEKHKKSYSVKWFMAENMWLKLSLEQTI